MFVLKKDETFKSLYLPNFQFNYGCRVRVWETNPVKNILTNVGPVRNPGVPIVLRGAGERGVPETGIS